MVFGLLRKWRLCRMFKPVEAMRVVFSSVDIPDRYEAMDLFTDFLKSLSPNVCHIASLDILFGRLPAGSSRIDLLSNTLDHLHRCGCGRLALNAGDEGIYPRLAVAHAHKMAVSANTSLFTELDISGGIFLSRELLPWVLANTAHNSSVVRLKLAGSNFGALLRHVYFESLESCELSGVSLHQLRSFLERHRSVKTVKLFHLRDETNPVNGKRGRLELPALVDLSGKASQISSFLSLLKTPPSRLDVLTFKTPYSFRDSPQSTFDTKAHLDIFGYLAVNDVHIDVLYIMVPPLSLHSTSFFRDSLKQSANRISVLYVEIILDVLEGTTKAVQQAIILVGDPRFPSMHATDTGVQNMVLPWFGLFSNVKRVTITDRYGHLEANTAKTFIQSFSDLYRAVQLSCSYAKD